MHGAAASIAYCSPATVGPPFEAGGTSPLVAGESSATRMKVST